MHCGDSPIQAKPQKDTDSVINRFEIIRGRALQEAGFDMSFVRLAFLLLTILGNPKNQWQLLQAPTPEALPRDQAQYNAFCQCIRRNSHLYDKGVDSVKNMSFFVGQNESTHEAEQHFAIFPSTNQWSEPSPMYSASPMIESDEPTDDGLSNCSSGASIPALSDVHDLPTNAAREQLYLGYRRHKRRRRSFTGGARRQSFKRRGKGCKGKGFKGQFAGKGQCQGKTPGKFRGKKGRMFFLRDMSGTMHAVADEDESSEQGYEEDQVAYFGNGKFKRQNPKGQGWQTTAL